jgi:hypothetical protein
MHLSEADFTRLGGMNTLSSSEEQEEWTTKSQPLCSVAVDDGGPVTLRMNTVIMLKALMHLGL